MGFIVLVWAVAKREVRLGVCLGGREVREGVGFGGDGFFVRSTDNDVIACSYDK